VYQYWFDDPTSLRAKYKFAREKGLLGIGPFVFNNLDPIEAKEDAMKMWSSFDEFFVDLEETTHGIRIY
jgi:spore germination protein YaaH